MTTSMTKVTVLDHGDNTSESFVDLREKLLGKLVEIETADALTAAQLSEDIAEIARRITTRSSSVFVEGDWATRSELSRQVGDTHYKSLAIQPVEYAHRNGLGFIAGSIIKYVTQYKSKGGVEDLRKAQHYLALLIEFEYGDEKSSGGCLTDTP